MNNIDNIRNLSTATLEKLKKDELLIALKTVLSDSSLFSSVMTKLDTIITEINLKNFELQNDITEIKKENQFLKNTILQHQKFFESIEAEKRAKNVIILCLPEVGLDLFHESNSYKTDHEKLNLIITILGTNPEVEDIIRLGAEIPSDINKPRPVKIIL